VKSNVVNIAYFNSGKSGGKEILAFSLNTFKVSLEGLDQSISVGRFGYLSYDLKNELLKLPSRNFSRFNWPSFEFFDADIMIVKTKGQIQINGKEELFSEYVDPFLNEDITTIADTLNLKLSATISKQEYLKSVRAIQHQLQMGNIYEMNFCQEFVGELKDKSVALSMAHRVMRAADTPFSGFLKMGDKWIMSGSPERYLKKEGLQLTSEPIKGTARRFPDITKDNQVKKELQNSVKERAENLMIVDLVRNDLSKIACSESVVVDELCGIYSFETVHQMISTISCKLKDDTGLKEILKATFPMGSMTGAPKYSAMSLIEMFENFKRGVYSGSIGYIMPNKDFDFNVVIRSVLWDASTGELSAPVGGAITIDSIPEDEYAECLIKLSAIKTALS